VIDHQFVKVLRIIVSRLENKGINWVLGGSLNLALQDVDVSPRDIDILTDKSGAFQIGELLKDYEIQKVESTKTEKFSSYLGKFRIRGLEVEVIGEFQAKMSQGEWTEPFKPKHKTTLKLENMKIPASPLEVELQAYQILGRAERVQKIREALELKRKQKQSMVC